LFVLILRGGQPTFFEIVQIEAADGGNCFVPVSLVQFGFINFIFADMSVAFSEKNNAEGEGTVVSLSKNWKNESAISGICGKSQFGNSIQTTVLLCPVLGNICIFLLFSSTTFVGKSRKPRSA
jgi:hypothetical protein